MSRDEDPIPRDLRKRAERIAAQAEATGGGSSDPSPRGLREASGLIHDLRVHQIELELQNEELRETQRRLEDVRDGYARLYNEAPVGYITVDANCLVMQANRTFLELAGIDGASLLGTSLADRLASPDRETFLGRFKAFFRNPEGKDFEARLAGSEPHRWIRMTGRFDRLGQGFSGLNKESPRLLLAVTDVSQQRESDDRIRRLLSDKELLLREVHHRVKNNMNSIAALLDIQASRLGEESLSAAALRQAVERIHGMMAIYERLLISSDYVHIDADEYLGKLVDDFAASVATGKPIRFHHAIEGIELDAQVIFPLGIILNELLTNAVKYAFPEGRGGSVLIEMRRHGRNRALLLVTDDGVGFADATPRAGGGGGFGLPLIKALVVQIGGTLIQSVAAPEVGEARGAMISIEFEIGAASQG